MRKLIASAVSAVTTASLLASFAPSAYALDPVKLGDCNYDGYVDASDASEMLAYYAAASTGASASVSLDVTYADMNGDKKIDASDASFVLGYYSYSSTGGEVSSEEFMEVKNLESRGVYLYLEPEVYLGNGSVRVKLADISDNEQYKEQYSQDFKLCGYDISLKKSLADEDGSMVINEEYTDNITKSERWYPSYSGMKTEKCDVVSISVPEKLEYSGDERYTVELTPHVMINGIEVKGKSSSCDIAEMQFIINNAELTTHDSYPLYNIKGASPVLKTKYSVSAKDKEILDSFAKEHFTDDMGSFEKLETTWKWLNLNVTYASGDLYKDIISDSWVSACFVKKKGQCLQYNGAIAEMLAYMGYDVYMLEMWLNPDNTNQHFRTEVNIDGQAYSIEVGNNGSYAGWMWFFEPIESSIKGAK